MSSWQQVRALEAQTRQDLLAAAPCAEGWSRHDPWANGDDCVHTGWWVRAVLGCLCCSCLAFAMAVLLLGRKSLAKGQMALCNANRQVVMAAVSTALASAASLHETELKSPLSLALWCAVALFVIECSFAFAVDVFLMGCVDTCFAMDPSRALRLKGYAVAFASAAQNTCSIGVLFSLASGDFVFALAWTAAFLACIVALYMAAAYLASTAAARLPDKDETKQLRWRLRRLRKAALMSAGPIALFALGFALVVAVPVLRRQGGAFGTAVILLGVCVLLWHVVIASRQRQHRRQQATVTPCASPGGAEVRRLSDAEGAARTDLMDPNHSAAALALGVHERGVSLAFLRRFAQQKGVGQRVSTAEVCEQAVKPAARELGCAYFAMLAHDGDAALVGRNDYFLSHTWSYRFHDVIRILENFEARLPVQSTPRYYWFDIFVMNQHSTTEIGENLLQNLHRSIEAPGKLLLLVDSWRDPVPLARCWCLFEIYTAIQCGADIIMCLSRSEENSFTGELDSNQVELALQLQAIDAEEAEATVESDKAMIFGRIREEIGFEAFNAKLRDTLLAALQQTVMVASNPFRSSSSTARKPRRHSVAI